MFELFKLMHLTHGVHATTCPLFFSAWQNNGGDEDDDDGSACWEESSFRYRFAPTTLSMRLFVDFLEVIVSASAFVCMYEWMCEGERERE